MAPWLQRLVTVGVGVGIGVVGLVFPPAATVTTPVAALVIGWAAKHPADGKAE